MAKKKNRNQDMFASGVASGLKPETAYIAAGYSVKFAKENSFRLMQKPYIQERIGELRKVAMAKLAEKELIQEQHARTASLEASDKFNGRIITIERWVTHVLDMIDKCQEQDDMTNNRGFTEMLAKHLGAYDADNRQKRAQVLQANITLETDAKKASDIYAEFIKNTG